MTSTNDAPTDQPTESSAPKGAKPGPFMRFVDPDGWFHSTETPHLKAVLDNLRSYPVLALFYFVARNVPVVPDAVAISKALSYFLVSLLVFLSAATFIQTAMLLTSVIFGLILDYLPNRFRPFVKKHIEWLTFPVGLLFFFCLFLAMVIAGTLDQIRLHP